MCACVHIYAQTYMCACVCTHPIVHVEVRREVGGVGSVLLLCGLWGTQVVSLGPQSLFSRSPPTAPGLTLGHLSCCVADVFLPRPLPQCVFEAESHCVTQTALNLMIFLLQFPEPLNHRCVPLN